MDDSNKYLIHAEIRADGVVERNDVVGAVYGQTEGLLGEDLDLRTLQRSSKIGRIDVEIEAAGGQSVGRITVATSLDKVETATLAAALETIDRVGPCRASVEVVELEDVRAAKRRQVVERARELLVEEFEEASSEAIVEEVRRQVETGEVEEYEGVPAGPGIEEADAIVVVEGRSDVVALLEAGVENAVAVEGTNVPDAVADLTRERTVTTFLDGDRGGDLILRELEQVGDVDYVAFAPAGRSVEDLSASEIRTALREKVPYGAVADAANPRDVVDGDEEGAVVAEAPSADGGTEAVAPTGGTDLPEEDAPADPAPPEADESGAAAEAESGAAAAETAPEAVEDGTPAEAAADPADAAAPDEADDAAAAPEDEAPDPTTIQGHADAVIREGTGRVRLLDESFELLDEAPAEAAFETVEAADPAPAAVVLDGTLTQRLLDVAAQRGVRQVVAAEYGSFTKRPTAVRIRTVEELFAT